jgi:nucleotide-binding universal stress UspA family protein
MLKEIKKVLVPVDFSDNSPKIFTAAVSMARRYGAELIAVFVVESFVDYDGFFIEHMPNFQFHEEMQASSAQKMEQFLKDYLPQDLTGSSAVLLGDAAEEIVALAAKEGVDLIVIGTHGYKGLDRVLFGSVAAQVVKTAPCPVLTVNPWR